MEQRVGECADGHRHHRQHALAADAVRQHAHQRAQHQDDGAADGGGLERRAQRQAQLLLGVRRHVEHQHVGADRPEDGHAQAGQHFARMVAQHLRERRKLHIVRASLGLARLELGRLFQMRADVHAHGADQQPEQERDAPAPGIDLLGAQAVGHQRAHRRAEHEGDALAGLLPAGIGAALLVRCMFDQERGGAANFAAGREALDQPCHHDQRRGPQADAVVGGGQADDGRAERHQQDGQRQRRLAADAVGVDAEHDGAHGPHEEAHAEGGHGQQERGQVVAGGEEQLGDDDREEAVDGEIEPFQAIADGRGEDRASSGGFGEVIGGGNCDGHYTLI
ncbi:hypothetical protein D3C87_1319690 [compost metagenome]